MYVCNYNCNFIGKKGLINVTFLPERTIATFNVNYDYVFECNITMFTIDLHIINLEDLPRVTCVNYCDTKIIIKDGMFIIHNNNNNSNIIIVINNNQVLKKIKITVKSYIKTGRI